MALAGNELRCANCGAPLEATPNAVVLVCGYCGWSATVEGAEVKPFVLEAEDKSFLRGFLERYVRSRAGGGSSVLEVKYLMVPVWAVEVHAATSYNGYRSETRTRTTGVGKNARTTAYTVYVPVKGEFDEDLAVAVYGRKFESIFGLGAVKSSLLSRLDAAVELDPSLTKGWEALGSELSREEAVEAAKTRAAEEHRKRAEKMTSRLFDCYTKAEPKSTRLILYPVLEARYESRGKSYRVCVDGVKGSARVLKAELPISAAARLGRAVAAAAVVLALALAAVFLQPLIGSDLPEEAQLAIIAVPPIAAGAAGFLGSLSATAVQRIAKAVEETDIAVLR
ncbi:MAG: hypothetical protein NZ941_06045 [Candidatus Caldarchaeum sp.]|nr:hypothetical protein [Candidatus Caldarchaeum sp.]MDW7978215.1 hypothetical protein [Candidatus Caldarchaeum sp.]